MRALVTGFGLALCLGLAAAGCSSSGVSCTDKGGVCNPGAVCPAGKQPPTAAQLTAAGLDSQAYACPAVVGSGSTDNPTCCLPIPVTD